MDHNEAVAQLFSAAQAMYPGSREDAVATLVNAAASAAVEAGCEAYDAGAWLAETMETVAAARDVKGRA